MMRAFIAKKFPGEDWRNAMLAAENDEVDLFERVVDNEIRHESDNNLEESYGNVHAPPNTMQQLRLDNCTRTKEGYANSSLPHEHMIAKKAHTENCVEANHGCAESALPREQVTNQDNSEVFLFSTNLRNKNKVVAKEGLVSKDKTRVVGGDMLGDEYFGVAVHAVTNIADKRLLRPYENIHTVRDDIGCVVAWPRSYVKRAKKTTSDRSQNNLLCRIIEDYNENAMEIEC